jgi:hypothetical protein
MNALIKSILIAGGFLFAQSSFAAQWYFDAGLGNANLESDLGGGLEVEGDDTYLRVAVGAEFSEALAVEGGYWDLGEASDNVLGLVDVSSSVDGLFGDVKGSMALNSDTALFGKIGLYLWDADSCVEGFGCEGNDGNDLFYGGGVGFDMGPGTLNLELLLMSLDDADVTNLGLSYSFPFGK